VGLLDALARPRTAKQLAGQQGEDRALHFLREKGLVLVERNFRCKGGELDLVMQDGKALVFVEVRQRSGAAFGGAAASVTRQKQRRMIVAAQIFLQRYRMPPACRFDVIALDGDSLDWIRNAVEA
jgi:putative endonuclease